MFYILWHRLEEMLCKRENHFLESEKAREQETEGGILRGGDAPEPATPFPVHRSDTLPISHRISSALFHSSHFFPPSETFASSHCGVPANLLPLNQVPVLKLCH